jgi:hypothetical protein
VATFDDLTQEVLAHQFAPSQYTSYIQGKINQAQDYIAAQLDFRVLMQKYSVPVAVGTTSYALPADFQRLYNVTLTDGQGQVLPLGAEPLNEFETQPPSSGQPVRYCIEGNNLLIYPAPDSAYTITLRYFRLPTALVNANDEPETPPEYWDLLVSFALWHCFERENDYQAAQYHKARFDEDLAKARGELQYDTDDYTQIKRVGDNRTDPLAPTVWAV